MSRRQKKRELLKIKMSEKTTKSSEIVAATEPAENKEVDSITRTKAG